MAKKKRKTSCAYCERMQAKEDAQQWYMDRQIKRRMQADGSVWPWVGPLLFVVAIIAVSYHFLQ